MKKRTKGAAISRMLGVSKARGMGAVIKADLIAAVTKSIDRLGLTHVEVAERAGLARSAVTGILSGSLQRVTIDRVLRLVEAVGLEAKVRVRPAA
jgi:predicted XRE-type DNA-binding protein